MSNLFMILLPFLLILLFACVPLTLLGMWTYRDAKQRGQNAALWVLVVLLVPNLIGLLIYFLVGRKEITIPCEYCHQGIKQGSQYCQHCGAAIPAEPSHPQPKSSYKLLIAAAVTLVLPFIFFIVIAFGGFVTNSILSNSTGSAFQPGYSIGMLENNIGSTWEIRFAKANDSYFKYIHCPESESALQVTSNVKAGTLSLTVLCADGSEEGYDITNTENLSVPITGKPGSSVKLIIHAKEAQDGSIQVLCP